MIACGLHHITELTREEAFRGRGSLGPQHRVTDNCDTEERAIILTWPTFMQLLCTYHIGQSAWRWLRDAHNGVSMDERQELMSDLMNRSAESFDGSSGFLLRMALAGTMAFIAGTTCPHRIIVRHIILVLTVINFTDTQCQWAVIRCSMCTPAKSLQMCTKLTYRYYMPNTEKSLNLVKYRYRTLQ